MADGIFGGLRWASVSRKAEMGVEDADAVAACDPLRVTASRTGRWPMTFQPLDDTRDFHRSDAPAHPRGQKPMASVTGSRSTRPPTGRLVASRHDRHPQADRPNC